MKAPYLNQGSHHGRNCFQIDRGETEEPTIVAREAFARHDSGNRVLPREGEGSEQAAVVLTA